MSEDKPDNPPAFPQAEKLSQIIDEGQHRIQTPWVPANPGMTLRDYFAGQAIVGIIANASTQNAETLSKDAYIIADLMLKARQS